jgi:UDP-3-O-[3-hydroxymyristoyl] glucosamine N-acyltransferase
MADSRFFYNNGPISLKEIIDLTGATMLPGKESPLDKQINDVSPLETATSNQLSFLINTKYIDSFKTTKAGLCFIDEKFADKTPQTTTALVHSNPYKAYAIIASKLYPQNSSTGSISTNAIISNTAKIGKNCEIGNFVVIEDGAEIGDNSIIDHGSVIKQNVTIGSNAKISSNVTISHSIIGNNVLIHPGVRIGQDGFGFASDHTGHLKVPQLGIIRIGNNVEIGANSTIDRGSSQDTVIGDMCQLDNLVQLGHNVKLGMGCVIVAQAGVAGSSKLGNFVVLGGQVGVAGHLTIGDQVQVAAQSGVAKNIEDKEIMGGSPAVPIRQWHRQNFKLQKLTKE